MTHNTIAKLRRRIQTGGGGAPGSLEAVKNRAQLTSEVEGIAQFSESFFLVFEVMVAQFAKSAFGLVVFQEIVDLLKQRGVAFAKADGPRFLLKRLEDGSGGVRIALPVFVSGNLVIDEGVRFALQHFQNAGVFFVENE